MTIRLCALRISMLRDGKVWIPVLPERFSTPSGIVVRKVPVKVYRSPDAVLQQHCTNRVRSLDVIVSIELLTRFAAHAAKFAH